MNRALLEIVIYEKSRPLIVRVGAAGSCLPKFHALPYLSCGRTNSCTPCLRLDSSYFLSATAERTRPSAPSWLLPPTPSVPRGHRASDVSASGSGEIEVDAIAQPVFTDATEATGDGTGLMMSDQPTGDGTGGGRAATCATLPETARLVSRCAVCALTLAAGTPLAPWHSTSICGRKRRTQLPGEASDTPPPRPPEPVYCG